MLDATSDDSTLDELTEEFARRWRAGERPSIEEYADRYPQWADEIRDVFPTVQMMEDLKPRPADPTEPNLPTNNGTPAPQRLGEFRIIQELGRGGMGVVYEAVQESLGRHVALKVLPAHLLANEKLRARFHRESHAAARLHHTNIVPVFGVGEDAGLCYYVMQLIPGRGLDEVLKDEGGRMKDETNHPSSFILHPSQVARIGAQAADALAYAHSQGVLHRDIKPSNLLLDDRGQVWVTDFGVAKLVEEAHLTQSGDLVGTLKYMPPERFAGQSDARGDVYGLGITLYELLAGRPAFPDTTPQHLIHLITQADVPRLRKANPAVPPDLETIVLKAAARDPAQRYQTAAALAEDLRRFLDDRPILARRISPAGLAWRWCRRNPVTAGSLATVFLLMVAVTVVSVVSYVRTSAANQEAQKALASETAQREHAEATSELALDALNRIYDRFAPTRLVVTPPSDDAGAELPVQPALPPEAVRLLEDSLQTYEKIARSSREFPRLQAQAAEANHRIGDIRQRLGRFDESVIAYRTAIDLYAHLPAESAADEIRIKLARSYNELGRVLRTLQQFEEAGRAHSQAVRTLAEAPKPFADRPECRYELARSFYSLGQWDMFLFPGPLPPKVSGPGPPPALGLLGIGRNRPLFVKKSFGPPPEFPGGHPVHRAIGLLEQLVKEHPTVPEYRHLLACCYRDSPPGPGPWPPPAVWPGSDRAIELLRRLVADHPKVPDYKFDLCETLRRMPPPGFPGDAGDASQRRERLKEATDLSSDLVTEYPNVPQYTAAHAQYLDWLGMEAFLARDFDESERMHRKAVTYQSTLVKQYPAVVAYAFWLSLMECSLGRVLVERGELKEARTRFQSATDRLEGLRKNEPNFGFVHGPLGMAYGELSRVLTKSGETELAAKARKKAEELGPPGILRLVEKGDLRP
ncbi:MAG TPA: serine/threonine-protein kinase [Gemmataceae bacterium]|nr:serine/threonine-protein kinase [Gemmataceae bacterium]